MYLGAMPVMEMVRNTGEVGGVITCDVGLTLDEAERKGKQFDGKYLIQQCHAKHLPRFVVESLN